MNDEQVKKVITTPYLLATLIYRALDRTLLTAPKKKIAKRNLDFSKSHGVILTKFLKNPSTLFPARNDDDRKKRVEFMLLQFEKIGVNLDREIYDIEIEIALIGTAIKDFLADKTLRQNYLNSEVFQQQKKKVKGLRNMQLFLDLLYEDFLGEKRDNPLATDSKKNN